MHNLITVSDNRKAFELLHRCLLNLTLTSMDFFCMKFFRTSDHDNTSRMMENYVDLNNFENNNRSS